MEYNSLHININLDSYTHPYKVKLNLPRRKIICLDEFKLIYDWDQEDVFLIEYMGQSEILKNKLTSLNEIISFLYKYNIGLIDDDRIRRCNIEYNKIDKYEGKNKNAENLKKFISIYNQIENLKKKRLDICMRLFNKAIYFRELELVEESYIYLYKIIEIISNEVVNKAYIDNNLKGIEADTNLDIIIKKYLCQDNGINNYPDIVATIKNKLMDRYSSAKIKLYHLNKYIGTDIIDMDTIKKIVGFRNKLSHTNPYIDNKIEFNKIFLKLIEYVPEIICKYYLEIDYKNICCKLDCQFDKDVKFEEPIIVR